MLPGRGSQKRAPASPTHTRGASRILFCFVAAKFARAARANVKLRGEVAVAKAVAKLQSSQRRRKERRELLCECEPVCFGESEFACLSRSRTQCRPSPAWCSVVVGRVPNLLQLQERGTDETNLPGASSNLEICKQEEEEDCRERGEIQI